MVPRYTRTQSGYAGGGDASKDRGHALPEEGQGSKPAEEPTVNSHRLRKIVLPVCAHEDHPGATAYARALARSCSAEILLVHVATRTPQKGDDPISFDEVLATARAFDRVAESGLGPEDGIRMSRHIVSAPTVVDGIRVLSKKKKPDLIIMSTMGGMPPSACFFGSVTRKVLAEPPCPILCIKEPVSADAPPLDGRCAFKRILAVRQSTDRTRDPLDITLALTETGDAEIQVLDMTSVEPWPMNVAESAPQSPDSDTILRDVKRLRPGEFNSGHEPDTVRMEYAADGESLVTGLARYTKAHQVDLVVMHDAPFELIHDVECPVLSV